MNLALPDAACLAPLPATLADAAGMVPAFICR